MIELHKLYRLLYAYIVKIAKMEWNEMEYQNFSFEAFQLSQEIEQGFTRFFPMPFGRNLIVSNPAQAIQQGLDYLRALSAISEEECNAHLSNFDWETLRLEDAIQNAAKKELLEALVRNLEFWYKRYSKKMPNVEETEE